MKPSLYLLAGVGLIGIVGCGGVYDSTVTGIVTLDGHPLPRGTVAFNPENGSPAYGQINSTGEYTVMTGREEGLPAGSYVVTVVSNEAPTGLGKDGAPPPAGKPITPQWYRSKQTSGLNYAVEPGSNQIDIPLTSTPPTGTQIR
jgi:hypothetical protein